MENCPELLTQNKSQQLSILQEAMMKKSRMKAGGDN